MILFDDAAVSAFVAGQLGFERPWVNCRGIGFTENGKLVAGVVYHNYCPESGTIEISSASSNRKWLNRERLATIFDYPFGFSRMVVARIAETNTRARRIWRSLGADEYIIPRLRSAHEAEVIYTLTREQWNAGKFKGKRDEQARSPDPA